MNKVKEITFNEYKNYVLVTMPYIPNKELFTKIVTLIKSCREAVLTVQRNWCFNRGDLVNLRAAFDREHIPYQLNDLSDQDVMGRTLESLKQDREEVKRLQEKVKISQMSTSFQSMAVNESMQMDIPCAQQCPPSRININEYPTPAEQYNQPRLVACDYIQLRYNLQNKTEIVSVSTGKATLLADNWPKVNGSLDHLDLFLSICKIQKIDVQFVYNT